MIHGNDALIGIISLYPEREDEDSRGFRLAKAYQLKEKSDAQIVAVGEGVPYVGGRFRQVRWRLTREGWESHRHSL